MRKLLIGVALLAVCCLPAPAAAGDIVLGASVGKSELSFADAGLEFDASDSGWKAYGGFRFFKFFGLQAGYVDLGAPDDSVAGIDLSVDATGWDAFAEGVLPIGSHFELFAKAGYVLWESETTLSGLVSEVTEDDGNDLSYGVGAAFILGKLVGIRAEWERFDVEEADDVNFISLGIDFRF